jgi:hypothetical protein
VKVLLTDLNNVVKESELIFIYRFKGQHTDSSPTLGMVSGKLKVPEHNDDESDEDDEPIPDNIDVAADEIHHSISVIPAYHCCSKYHVSRSTGENGAN